ncbi:MAG: hypothetical protein HKO09_09440 [Croceitalea sp.]|nr:hypothetical protein [Croceitalea sp.]
MEFFIHLLKSSGILLLFFLVYTVFLKKETFFTTNRWFLITGLITALLLPFITLKKMVDVEAPMVFNANAMVFEASEPVIANAPPLFDSFKVLLLIYMLGVIVFLTRFMLQLFKINTLTKESVAKKVRGFFHIQTTKPVAPFSFFNNIYFYPKQFNNDELQNIIAHEEVHAKELHTLDILLLETVFILQWFNPIIWFYKKIVKQNLEYLADAQACEKGSCRKTYQYLMLKQAAGHQHLEITTTFYNSLIKKRIVMLNQNQSKKMNAWKLMVILPLLGLFLVGFNTETVYNYTNSDIAEAIAVDKSIELVINKDTSDEELQKMKDDLATDGIDFSYTVVHNDQKEIIDISIQLSGSGRDGENFSGSYNSSSDGPIKPLVIFYDDNTNTVSFSQSSDGAVHKMHTKGQNKMVWISSDHDENENTEKHEIIEIEKEGDNEVIRLNGKVVGRDELKSLGKSEKIFVKMLDVGDSIDGVITIDKIGVDENGSKEKIVIVREYDDEDEEHIHLKKDKQIKEKKIKIKKVISGDSDDDENVFILDGSDDDHEINIKGSSKAIYFINGKASSKKEFEKLSPEDIATINVYKGDKAVETYGKKAKNGVIEVVTKKQ